MGKKILLVEDEVNARQMATAALEEAGYEVVAVSGAREAVLQKDQSGLNLIVLDLDLGGENGLMLMKPLRRHHPDAPIIIYTGIEPDPPAIERMRGQGAHALLRKGAMSELVATVQRILGVENEN
jgi:DNA-binding NtrC family response regulator